MKNIVGLLVMAYGTPYKEDDIERYYTHIRHGRKPPQEQIEDLKARYRAIGGLSPLAKITEEQAKRLEERLNEVQDEVEFRMYLGLKHIEPFIEDAVERMHDDGIKEAVGIVLAPHYSTFSIRSYNERAKAAAEKLGGPVIYTIDQWYDEPKFLQYWSERVRAIFDAMPEQERERAVLIVSAHSLPEKSFKRATRIQNSSKTQPNVLPNKPASRITPSAGKAPAARRSHGLARTCKI